MSVTNDKVYTIQCVASSTYVNLAGTHSGTSISNGNVVNLYATCTGSDQKWKAEAFNSYQALTSSRNTGYALNIKVSTGICQAWNKTTCTVNDSKIDFPAVNESQGIYNIRLVSHDKYLTRTGTTDLYWASKNGTSTSQQFKFTEVSSADVTLGGEDTGSTLTGKVTVPIIKQTISGWCAACCMVSISKALGNSTASISDAYDQGYIDKNGVCQKSMGYMMTMTKQDAKYSIIKTELDAGRPIMIHGTGTKSGGASTQHWVVGYGYTGTCSDWTQVLVMDPQKTVSSTMKQAFDYNYCQVFEATRTFVKK